jgi:hypothetical protein
VEGGEGAMVAFRDYDIQVESGLGRGRGGMDSVRGAQGEIVMRDSDDHVTPKADALSTSASTSTMLSYPRIHASLIALPRTYYSGRQTVQ